ncbi:MAG: immune inhibitor A, partial [Actinobacteria bacterium]|nr:immune inhibitor A [Actinomycetota bacterium]
DEVSTNLGFMDGDCRNGERTQITDAQVESLVEEFDTNMYPKESEAFSVPPQRDGSSAALPELVGLPDDYYEGQGDNIVVLVDNVRDANFYDLNNTENNTYIAGFFYSVFNEYVDRNVMTIDAFDWLHRTGATPPNEPVPGDNCASAPARPYLYEGVFAHEYQHLLEYYEDPDELSWVNEGLSDWAQTLTGYVTPDKPITDIDFDSHVQCFLGYLGIQTPANPNPRAGGPENSLTSWGDQGDGEILCDYGAAYTMMEYLAGRYGTDFMSALHRDDLNGLEGLQGVLDASAPGESAQSVLHRWAAMVALDGVLDDGANLAGDREALYRSPTLDATINWDETNAYSTPGAPPNGSDYVRLRRPNGSYLGAGDLRRISFQGSTSLPPKPVEWTVDLQPKQHKGDPALYSGSGPNLDRTIVAEVTVPADDPTLTFDTKWRTEPLWDFGFVQVSTDGGATYESLANEDTTTETDPGAIEVVKENVPGFTGNSKGWRTESFDLSEYAGQQILISFRYVTDSAVDFPGWWIDDVAVGDTRVTDGTSLEGFRSVTEVRPVPVEGYTVQLVAYEEDGGGEARLAQLRLDDEMGASLRGGALRRAVGRRADVVAAIVMYDESTESITDYAPYSLKVNGALQPGG